jgi:hypothetical protein
MKHLFQIAFFLIITFSAAAQKQFVVDADAEVRIISGSFTGVRVSNGIQLYLSKADVEVVAISAREKSYRDAIKTEIENGELHIFYDGARSWNGRSQKLSVYVAYKNLEQITVSSAANVIIAGTMELPLLNIKLSGASDFKGLINIADLNVKCSGASDMKLSGTAKKMNIECSGASDVNAYNLVVENCTVKASGASDVFITASKEIITNASGASNIFYKGDAELKEKNSSGASTIAKKE